MSTVQIDYLGNTYANSEYLLKPSDIVDQTVNVVQPEEGNPFYPSFSIFATETQSSASSITALYSELPSNITQTKINVLSCTYSPDGYLYIVFDNYLTNDIIGVSFSLKVGAQRFNVASSTRSVINVGGVTHILKMTLQSFDKDTINYMVNQEMPSIFLVSPSPQQLLSSTNITLKFNITNFELGTKAGENGINLTIDSGTPTIIYTNETTLSLSNGNHTIKAQLINADSSLNTNIEAICESSFVVNTSSYSNPYIYINSPKANQTYSSDVANIEFTSLNFPIIPSGQHLQYVLDSEAAIDVYSTDPINLTDLAVGSHTITLTLVDENGESLGYTYGSVSTKFIVGLNSNAVVKLYASGDYIENGQSITLVDVANIRYMQMFSPLDIQFINPLSNNTTSPSVIIAKLKKTFQTSSEYSSSLSTASSSTQYSENSIVELDMDGIIKSTNNVADLANYKDQAENLLGSVEKLGDNTLLLGDSVNKRAIIVDTNTNQIIWQYDSDRYIPDFHLVNTDEITITVYDGSISSNLSYVRNGSTIIWENQSSAPISIYSGTTDYDLFIENPNLNIYGDVFQSGVLQPGESYSYKFVTNGEYDWFVYPSIITGTINVTVQRLSSQDQYLILESDGLDTPFSSRVIKVDSYGDLIWSFGEAMLVKPRDARPMKNNKVLIST